ncbi:PTS fructose transporter subunit IIA [Candidatus Endobugula sertula]|uniref:PTS fructose transporter subunit IIA n=1 Tax=Candidatus Endobugula sertula TaxID=62101 RepID=A0A1D2QQM0_9GAMM|nr:PTS fructose transporter subunit IIA [Candidatus Endobugula sertula]
MNIASLLSPKSVLCKHSSSSKKRLLEDMAEYICKQYTELDSNTVFRALISREKLGSTSIGNGIAIPHCRIPQCNKTIGMLVTLDQGIEFNAIDNQNVDIIFTLLVPEGANDKHLQTLACIAETLSNDVILNNIRHAQQSEELLQVLQ